MSVDKTLEERGNTHGDFRHNATVSQTIKFALETGPSWEMMTDYQKEALHMIAHKMSRIVAGNPDHLDHWHDIAGYAKLAEDRTAADKPQ